MSARMDSPDKGRGSEILPEMQKSLLEQTAQERDSDTEGEALMLQISKSTIKTLVTASRERLDAQRQKYPGPVISMADIDLEDYFRDPYSDKVAATIAALPKTEQLEIAALTWVGRGTSSDFKSAFDHAKDVANDDDWPLYLAEKPLHKFLPEGVQKAAAEGFTLAGDTSIGG
jgi:hypothetical protein